MPPALIILLGLLLAVDGDFSLGNVCQARPQQCNLLCPYGYLRDVHSTCLCACAIDPCQTTICLPSETCIAVGVVAKCIVKIGGTPRPECPRLTGGVCALRCDRDADCTGRLVCCPNGCGKECVTPLTQSFPIKAQKPIQPVVGSFHRLLNAVSQIATGTLKTVATPAPVRSFSSFVPEAIRSSVRTVKVGQCPQPLGDQTCQAQPKCSNDFDCTNYEKCCANECGATCVLPVKTTSCIHFVIAVLKLPQGKLANDFVPVCESNGRFASVQCDSRWCWCVDVHYGVEIAGTRTEKTQRHEEMCTASRPCSNKCGNQCAHGHIMDAFGCPHVSCTCVDVCARIRCKNPSETCQLVEPDCANPPCLPVPRCLLNPCEVEGPMVLSNGITALCSGSKDCGRGHSCFKIGYNGLGFCCKGDRKAKDGRCPSKSVSKSASNCFSTCKGDFDCPQELKCCFDGCALACVAPEFFSLKKSNPLKTSSYQPGDVERYNKQLLTSLVADCADIVVAANASCHNQCQADADCAGMKRCCRNGCSTTCQYPFRSTPCFHLALTAELYSLRNAMKCDRAGNFDQHQCDDEGCYCVDIATGEEVSGSRVVAGKPNCSAPSECKPLVCPTICPFGFEKGADHCPTCRCRNACNEVKCPQGSVCVMSKVQCYQRDNCPLQPRCVLNFCHSGDPYVSALGAVETCSDDADCPKATHWCHQLGLPSGGVCCPIPLRARHSGSCPVTAISLDSSKMCRVNCRVDEDCHVHQKCCFDGCGASCQEVESSVAAVMTENFEKVGVCISSSRVLCDRAEHDECKHDANCTGVQKCCYDGCRRLCTYPMQTSKCMVRKTNLQKLGQLDVIKCKPDGSFEQIQCDSDFCWCVDDDGNYVEGTKTADDTPHCPVCPKLNCDKLYCEYGRSKDSNGCDTCDCLNPCEGITCPSDSICTPTPVACIREPCPTVPRCVINPCANAQAVLNVTTMRPLRCKHHKQCRNGLMATFCSMLTEDEGFCCSGKEPKLHPGSCQRLVDDDAEELCTKECSVDGDCDSAEKCCWNGCGLGCQSATFAAAPAAVHIGECLPVPTLGAFCLQRPTVEECKKDDDCPSLYLCCFDGCVKRCSQPHRTTLCIHTRLSAVQLTDDSGATFVAECDSRGNFDEIQTHFGLMWCVDENGFEIAGTKSTLVPDCQRPRACPVRSCPMRCPHGFKTDNNGCAVCDCVDPCEFDACPAGHVCRLVHVQCTSSPCHSVAKCIPNLCSTGEPLALESNELATCDVRSPCPAGSFCKNSGYAGISVCCATRDIQLNQCAVVPLTATSVDAAPCVVGCRQANDCIKSTCCFNGCGTSCQYESEKTTVTSFRGYPPSLPQRPLPMPPAVNANPMHRPFVLPLPVSAISVLPAMSLSPTTVFPVVATPKELPVRQKLGTCKKVLLNPGCADLCAHDADCPDYLKCCTATCGTVCAAPEIATACIHRLHAFEQKQRGDGSTLPPPVQCSADGYFREHQCDTKAKQCWCVNTLDGIEDQGTRISSELSLPDCSLPRMCSVRCDASKCPYGVRLDSNGCPMNGACECSNICQTFECPVAMECALRPVRCTSHPCPDVPTCIESLCATPQRDVFRNAVVCTADLGSCDKSAKCMMSSPRSQLGICCLQRTHTTTTTTTTPSTTAATTSQVVVVNTIPLHKALQTNCTTMQNALDALRRGGAIIKSATQVCDVNGNYKSTQCDANKCWCVDVVSGEEVFGTRGPSDRNVCQSRSVCATRCSSSMCPYGLVLDRAGCPRAECVCKSPCEDVECVTGEVCILRRAECGSRWCLPTPKCERSPCNSGMRPLVESRTRQQFSCTGGSICPAGYYCTAYDENMHGVCCPGRDPILSVGKKEHSCPHGDPFAASSDGTPFACTALSNGCPPTHYCSMKAGHTTGVCCVSKRFVCNLQADGGPCNGALPRVFYSSLNHTCTVFQYGGCAGNINNFATIADCDNFCAGIGLDLSSPYNENEASSPVESYQLGFTLTGQRIDSSRKKDAERELVFVLSEKFGVPRGSVEDVHIRDDNSVRFTIRDVDAQRFARQISELVSSGKLALNLAGSPLKAEAHTLVAHHIAHESPSQHTAKVVFFAILFAACLFTLLVVCIICVVCMCFYRRGSKHSQRDLTPTNTLVGSIIAERLPPRPVRRIERVFSRENVSICSNRLADERPVSRSYY